MWAAPYERFIASVSVRRHNLLANKAPKGMP